MGDIDAELRRYRVDLHSIAMGFPEPGSAYKLRMTFEDDFGDVVPFRKFGYMNFDAFLNDHPTLERVMVEGKICYRAKMSERSAEIQELVARQKKKKRRNGKKPAPFQRNVPNRSFQGRPPVRGAPQFGNNTCNQRSFRGASSGFAGGRGGAAPGFAGGRGGATPGFAEGRPTPQTGFARSSFSTLSKQWPTPHTRQFGEFGTSSGDFGTRSGGFGASNSGFGARPGAPHLHPSPSAPTLLPTPIVGRNVYTPMEAGGPAAGKARIIAALKKCQGKATLTKLNYCYQQLYNTQLDANEMQKFFSTKNFAAIHRDWLSGEMDLNPDPSGQWVFMSKEIAKQQQEWAAAHKNLTVDSTRPKWDKPTVKELFDKVVAMLVNMYPVPLQISQMSEIYKRAHGVQVNTMDLYCKTWEDLVTGIFRDKMALKPDGTVVLSDKAVRDNGLTATAAPITAHATIKRVTADDLGLEYSDDSESDGDEDDSTSNCSNNTVSSNAPTPQKNSSAQGSTSFFQSAQPREESVFDRPCFFHRLARGENRKPPTLGPTASLFPSVKEMEDSLKAFMPKKDAPSVASGATFGRQGFTDSRSVFDDLWNLHTTTPNHQK